VNAPAAPSGPLISASALAQALAGHASGPTQADWLLLDCRFNLATPDSGEQAYAQGHLPGAVYAHLDRDLSGPKTGRNGRHPLPTPQALAATLGAWGLTPQTRVVAYDDGNSMFAARAWWLLRWLGIDQVQVLDGGLAAWMVDAGHHVEALLTTATPQRPPSHVQPKPQTSWVVDAHAVLAGLHSPDLTLLDARSAERFAGQGETLDPVGGHIPGARNRWFGLNLQADGRFKPPAALREAFLTTLEDRALTSLVHQCGSGVTACHNLLAMAHAGLPITRLYPGSWSEWCADPARPVAAT
jgi:thiosulfate/3-mercaptopyruvate sulfurtransferase